MKEPTRKVRVDVQDGTLNISWATQEKGKKKKKKEKKKKKKGTNTHIQSKRAVFCGLFFRKITFV